MWHEINVKLATMYKFVLAMSRQTYRVSDQFGLIAIMVYVTFLVCVGKLRDLHLCCVVRCAPVFFVM